MNTADFVAARLKQPPRIQAVPVPVAGVPVPTVPVASTVPVEDEGAMISIATADLTEAQKLRLVSHPTVQVFVPDGLLFGQGMGSPTGGLVERLVATIRVFATIAHGLLDVPATAVARTLVGYFGLVERIKIGIPATAGVFAAIAHGLIDVPATAQAEIGASFTASNSKSRLVLDQ